MKIKYHRAVFVAFVFLQVSYIFLQCQEISSQELGAVAVAVGVLLNLTALFYSKATYKKEAIIWCCYLLFQMIYSYTTYGQSIQVYVYMVANQFTILAYAYFYYFRNSHEWYYESYKKIATFFMFAVIVIWFLTSMGINILDEKAFTIRNGRPRIAGGMVMVAFLVLMIWCEIVDKRNQKRKTKYASYVLLAIGLLYINFINQTRMCLLATVGAAAIVYLLSRKGSGNKVIAICVAIMACVFVFQIPAVQTLLNDKFGGLIDGTDNSMVPRLGAITHYIEMAQGHEIFGIGLIQPTQPGNGKYDLSYIMNGPWGVYSSDDVGMVSFYAVYGLVGLVFYLILMIRLFKRAWGERKEHSYKLAIWLYVFMSGFSMMLTDLWRQDMIAVFLLLEDISFNQENSFLQKEVLHEKLNQVG